VLGALALLTAIRAQPPRALRSSQAGSGFSAWDARSSLIELLADDVPHPVGSAADGKVRDRIVARLRAIGYEPEVRRSFVCDRHGTCGQVENVTARLPGRRPGHAVLVSVHYDSVAAGPGAADDGSGVVIALELAKHLRADAPPRNDVVFLFDEGEEAGLLGAQAFVQEDPRANEVAVVVNLEARGSSGRSFLFETSHDNAWLIRLFGAVASRPATSSLFQSVYERLPNDTDLTVFKHAGYSGVNFAFIGDVQHQHTPRDTVANLDPGSLQQQGNNALAMVRALADADLTQSRPGRAMWFDLFGFCVLAWSVGTGRVLALAAALLVALAIFLAWRRGLLRLGAVAAAVLAWPLTIAGSGATVWILIRLVRASGGLNSTWVAHPWPLVTAAWLIGVAIPHLAAIALGRWARSNEAWSGSMLWLAGLALLLGFILPGMSYLFLVPASVGGVVGLLVTWFGTGDGQWGWLRGTLSAAAAACVLFPLAWAFYDAMGIPALAVVASLVAIPVGFVSSPSRLGATRRSRSALVLIAVAAFLVVGGSFLPSSTRAKPRRLNLVYSLNANTGTARWWTTASRLPPTMRKLNEWSRAPYQPLPWVRRSGSVLSAPAAAARLVAPELKTVENVRVDGKRRLILRFRSMRSAGRGYVAFHHAHVEALRVNGQFVPVESGASRSDVAPGWRLVRLADLPTDGVTLELRLADSEPLEVVFGDETSGLPSAGDGLLAARPASAVPSGAGDRTVVQKTLTL